LVASDPAGLGVVGLLPAPTGTTSCTTSWLTFASEVKRFEANVHEPIIDVRRINDRKNDFFRCFMKIVVLLCKQTYASKVLALVNDL
jgi:hypothetical protein